MPDLPPFPFVVGSIRSGTTLLRLMLDAHPNLAIPPESYFVARLWSTRHRYAGPHGLDVDAIADDLIAEPRLHHFRAWAVPPSVVRRRLAEQAPGSLPEVVRLLYALYAERHGKERYGDKTPVFVMKVDLLAGLFPESRFVHLLRDGRDVALSVLALGNPDHPRTLPATARMWATWVQAGRAAGTRLGPDRYLEVRYEDLVADPEGQLRRVCSFVDLGYRPEMLGYAVRGLDRIPAGERWQHRHASDPPVAGLRDWRRQMTPRQVALFEAVAGPVLEEVGYERSVDRVPLAARLRARTGGAAARLRRAGGVAVHALRGPGDGSLQRGTSSR